jgi:hypothetical protein
MERASGNVGEGGAHPDGAAPVKGSGGFDGGVWRRSRSMSGGHRTCMSGPARARNTLLPIRATSSAKDRRGGDEVLHLRHL